MRLDNSKWIIVIVAVIALLMPAAIVWASAPATAPSIPLQSTPGLDADKVDGRDAAASWAPSSQRKGRLLWAQANGRLHWRAFPTRWFDDQYVNDDRQELIKAKVDKTQGHGAVLKVQNTDVASGGYAIVGLNASDSIWSPAIYGENTGKSAGVWGESTSGTGVYGTSPSGTGVYGSSTSGKGVHGFSNSNYGVHGASLSNTGVYAWTVSGVGMQANSASGNIIEGWDANPVNRRFRVRNDGHVYADGSFHSGGADLAEMLPAADGLEPGDVLVVGPDGRLILSAAPNSSNVAGVYSTQPGLVGGDSDDDDPTGKVPLAIAGVVPVKVSTENGAIQPGDLLTTSSTPGHAMKANRPAEPGTILGKAMEPLKDGTGVISVLVTLQ